MKRTILGGRLRHGGKPLLRICFGDVVAARDDTENEKFTKERSRGRIEGTAAASGKLQWRGGV
jgi:phage terminase large subunit-like protein